jgi:hypothetical protein
MILHEKAIVGNSFVIHCQKFPGNPEPANAPRAKASIISGSLRVEERLADFGR